MENVLWLSHLYLIKFLRVFYAFVMLIWLHCFLCQHFGFDMFFNIFSCLLLSFRFSYCVWGFHCWAVTPCNLKVFTFSKSYDNNVTVLYGLVWFLDVLLFLSFLLSCAPSISHSHLRVWFLSLTFSCSYLPSRASLVSPGLASFWSPLSHVSSSCLCLFSEVFCVWSDPVCSRLFSFLVSSLRVYAWLVVVWVFYHYLPHLWFGLCLSVFQFLFFYK